MKLRGLVLSGLLAVLFAPAASAQGSGTVEFGLFARKNWFGESYSLSNRTGGGLRLGFFPVNHIEIGVSGAYTPARFVAKPGRVDAMNAAAELLGHIPMGEHAAMFLGGRYVFNKYWDKRDIVNDKLADDNE